VAESMGLKTEMIYERILNRKMSPMAWGGGCSKYVIKIFGNRKVGGEELLYNELFGINKI
jgi:hypothetical protein